MTVKKYPHIILTSVSTNGNYFGAFAENDSDSKKGYVVFVTTSSNEKDYCECMGFVHGKNCYHLTEAKKLNQKLFGITDIASALERANKERESGGEREDGQ
jgi:hypothetical protein